MNKRQIADIVAKKAHTTKKEANEVIEVFLNEIIEQVKKGEKVVLSGFGTIKLGWVADKQGRKSPKDPTPKVHKAHHVVRFLSGKPFKKAVRQK